LDHCGAIFRGFVDEARSFLYYLHVCRIARQQLRLTEDGRQYIVEIMGDPRGHLTQATQFLGLEQSFPQSFVLGHIFDDR
jgi:hypothetical protein